MVGTDSSSTKVFLPPLFLGKVIEIVKSTPVKRCDLTATGQGAEKTSQLLMFVLGTRVTVSLEVTGLDKLESLHAFNTLSMYSSENCTAGCCTTEV